MRKALTTAIGLIIAFLATTYIAEAQVPFTPPEIILYTDRQVYKPGEEVVILGTVVDEEFNPAPDVAVSILVQDSENTIVLDTEATTNQSGVFTASLRLARDAVEGEYLITATAEAGEYTPGLRAFLVCGICITEPEVVIVTTTLPGLTITTTLTTTALTTVTSTAIVQTTVTAEGTAPGDTLTMVFIAIVAALFIVVIIAVRRYG
ncbi:MAG: MG2 domain-containing protein [Nitrososphaerota archaeon]